MERVWEAAKRQIEALLDDAVEKAMDLPDGPERDELNRRINALDELLLAETT